MQILIVISFTMLTLFCPFYSAGSDFKDESTPAEREDSRSVDQISQERSFEDESTPAEREDSMTIDQMNDDDSFEEGSTPAEQEDLKTIDQINQ